MYISLYLYLFFLPVVCLLIGISRTTRTTRSSRCSGERRKLSQLSQVFAFLTLFAACASFSCGWPKLLLFSPGKRWQRWADGTARYIRTTGKLLPIVTLLSQISVKY